MQTSETQQTKSRKARYHEKKNKMYREMRAQQRGSNLSERVQPGTSEVFVQKNNDGEVSFVVSDTLANQGVKLKIDQKELESRQASYDRPRRDYDYDYARRYNRPYRNRSRSPESHEKITEFK